MPSTLERRDDLEERVPLHMAVELGHGDFRDPFAASVCNVSKGGISMRATCLPDVGSQLMCRFRCMPSNTLVTVQGEIVWAHLDGENCGEFGLAFVDVDPKTEWLIEEMIAEHMALTRDADAAAPVATLELDGSPAPIEARLSHRGGGRAVFEQDLDLLSLGRGVRAHAGGRDLLAGNIASVELRMVGAVPMLTVTVAFEHGAEVAVGGQIELPVHDTEPDLAAPTGALAEAMPEAAPRMARPGTQPDLFDAMLGADEPALAQQMLDAPLSEAAVAAPAALVPAAVRPVAPESRREHSVQFRTAAPPAVVDEDDDAAFEAELEAVRASVWKPLLVASMRRGRALAMAAYTALRPLLLAASRAALPILRGGVARTMSRTRALYRVQVAPQLGAMRRVVVAQVSSRRRRVTAGPNHAPRARVAPVGRTLLLGVLAASAVGLAVYALVPTASDESVVPHRKVRHKRAQAKTEALAAVEGAASNAASAAPAGADTATAASSAAPSTAVASGKPATPGAAAASAANAPAGAAAAAATSAPAEAKAAPRKLRFGATRVPGGRQFALRMSAPIQSIDGLADRGGFSVVVHGALSLDRAGPIGSAHKSVSHAMVINKGDHAELSIRFSDGKHPAYQVSADGSTLYITIQDA